jgi:hypothetical protein
MSLCPRDREVSVSLRRVVVPLRIDLQIDLLFVGECRLVALVCRRKRWHRVVRNLAQHRIKHYVYGDDFFL